MATPAEQAAAALGAELAAASGAVRSFAELVAKLTDDFEQFQGVVRRTRNPRAQDFVGPSLPDLPSDFVGPPQPGQSHGPKPGAAGAAAADCCCPTDELERALKDLTDAAKALLKMGGFGPPPPPPGPIQRKPQHGLLTRLRRRVSAGLTRLGKRTIGRAATRTIGRNFKSLRAGFAATGKGAGIRGGATAGQTSRIGFGAGAEVAGLAAGAAGAAVGKLVSVGQSMFGQLSRSITQHLTPLGLLSQAITASTSGFNVFNKAVALVGAQVGLLLLPAFMKLTGVALALVARFNSSQAPTQESTQDSYLTGLKMFVLQLKRDLGGQAQSTSLSDLGKQSQLAGLNADPFQTEMLKLQRQAVMAAEKMLKMEEAKADERRRKTGNQ